MQADGDKSPVVILSPFDLALARKREAVRIVQEAIDKEAFCKCPAQIVPLSIGDLFQFLCSPVRKRQLEVFHDPGVARRSSELGKLVDQAGGKFEKLKVRLVEVHKVHIG